MREVNSTYNCPKCGASIMSLLNTCPYCGYELSEVAPNSSMAELARIINEISKEGTARKLLAAQTVHANENGKKRFFEQSPIERTMYEISEDTRLRICQAILNFPIPHTKSDLFEFTSSMLGRINDDVFGATYRQKLDECLAKIEALYPYDKYFVSVKQSAEKAKCERRRKTVMIVVGIVAFFLALFMLVILEECGII